VIEGNRKLIAFTEALLVLAIAAGLRFLTEPLATAVLTALGLYLGGNGWEWWTKTRAAKG
jgi:hypothetical protein